MQILKMVKNHNAKNDVQILIERIKKININKLTLKNFINFIILKNILYSLLKNSVVDQHVDRRL